MSLTYSDCYQLSEVTLSFTWLGNTKVITIPVDGSFDPKTLGRRATLGEIKEAQKIAKHVLAAINRIRLSNRALAEIKEASDDC